MTWEIRTTTEFRQWLKDLQPKAEAQVRKRLTMIEISGNFGDMKHLGSGLCELRWKNGIRIYFARVGQSQILLLLGGTKNGQEKDIRKASRMLG